MANGVNMIMSLPAIFQCCNVAGHWQTGHPEDFGCCSLYSPIGRKGMSYEGHRSAPIRFDCGNHSFRPSNSYLSSRRKELLQTKVRVASDYSDSKPGSFEYQGELGYHPLEELRDYEEPGGDLRLTDAEIARTTVEVNNNAILMFSGMLHREPHEDISWAELQYVVDDYGDIYIEVNDNENILQSPRASNPVNVLIGLDDMQIYREQKTEVYEDYANLNSELKSDSDVEDDYEDDYDEDSISITQERQNSNTFESLGDWARLDTMNLVHPMYFARKMAKVVSTNYSEKMDLPSNGLAIIGLIRPAFMEEQSYVHKFLYGEDVSSTDDDYTGEDVLNIEPIESTATDDAVAGSRSMENPSIGELENTFGSDDLDVTNQSVRNKDELIEEYSFPEYNGSDLMSLMRPEDDDSWALGSENSKDSGIRSSLYKLEILSIHLISIYGDQSVVSLEDFQQAEPDFLAHSASAIIAHINAGGEKTERALKNLCWKKKGLHVEEAVIIGLDSLGVDLRVHFGAQVQTLRFAFNRRATSEDAAEQQLRRLLFPRFRHRRRRPRRDRHRGDRC